jgi:hypothetical protein
MTTDDEGGDAAPSMNALIMALMPPGFGATPLKEDSEAVASSGLRRPLAAKKGCIFSKNYSSSES